MDITWGDRRFPGGNGIEGQKWIAVRVVDKLSGKPIQNAELLLIHEAMAPIGGKPIEAWRIAGDSDGFLTVRADQGAVGYQPWNWLCVRAPGYCQHMVMGGFDDEVVVLSPSVNVQIQVRDWRDEAVSDALVGFCGGCGHTPDLVYGMTGSNGTVMLSGVDALDSIADFYVVHPELRLGYESPDWYPGNEPVVMRLLPGVPHRGVVVNHDGLPVANAAVGFPNVHRGPWVLTKSDGAFDLFGLDELSDLYVYHDGRMVIFGCAETNGLRLQLPEPSDNEQELVQLTRSASDAAEQRRELVQKQQLLRQASWPMVSVRAVGMPDDGAVTLRTKSRSYDLDDWFASGRNVATKVAIPDEPFVFVLSGDYDAERIIGGDHVRALKDGLVNLLWFNDTIVKGRIVNETGDPSSAMVSIEPLHQDRGEHEVLAGAIAKGGFSIPVKLTGMHMLVIRDRYSDAVRMMPIELPPRGDDVQVNLSTVVLRQGPQLQLLGPDGKPLIEGDVQLLRLGFEAWDFDPVDGEWFGPDLVDGDHVVLSAELPPIADLDVEEVIVIPSRFRIEGDGPWTFQQYAGEMLIDIDAGEELVGVTVGTHCISVDERTLLRGLKPGPHRVFISAAGRRSAIVEIEVSAAGKPRTLLKLALPARD